MGRTRLRRALSLGGEAVALSVTQSGPRNAPLLTVTLSGGLDQRVDAAAWLEDSSHHNYTLGPRPGLLHDREIARCLRHDLEPLDLTAAVVLHRAFTCPREDRARDALMNPAEHAAAERLIAAGLLEDDHGFLRPTPRAEATFSPE